MWIWNVPRTGAGLRSLFAADIQEIRQESRLFTNVGGAFPGTWNVTGVGEPQRLAGVRVTEDFFPTLRIRPFIGRLFRPDEYRTGREMVALLSYSFWKNHLGEDPNIVGRRISMDGVPFEIAGVMPQDFAYRRTSICGAPLPPDSPYAVGRKWRWVQACARLKPGVEASQVQAEMSMIATDLAARYPEDRGFG